MYVEVCIEILGTTKKPIKGFLPLESYDDDLSNWQNGEDRLLVYPEETAQEDHFSLGADLGPRAIVKVIINIEEEVTNGSA